MQIICPKDSTHKRFSVTAHVSEFWVVDDKVNWLETTGPGEVVHSPDSEDYYQCSVCHAKAEVRS